MRLVPFHYVTPIFTAEMIVNQSSYLQEFYNNLRHETTKLHHIKFPSVQKAQVGIHMQHQFDSTFFNCSSPLIDKPYSDSPEPEVDDDDNTKPGGDKPETIITRQPVQFMAVKSVISTAKSIDVKTATVRLSIIIVMSISCLSL